MKRFNVRLAIAIITVCGILVSGVAYAKDKTTVYEVTITNITRGQIISPPIVISHNKDFQLFILGDRGNPATPGLALLAEDGDRTTLETELGALDSVHRYSLAGGGIGPGESVTVDIETKRHFRYLSAASMLVSTNDAFWSIRGVYAHPWATMVVDARAYDAGSEANSEDCNFIPGPPCGNHVHDETTDAEGYVYLHSGIHGILDLDPAAADWNNPVAVIKVRKVK